MTAQPTEPTSEYEPPRPLQPIQPLEAAHRSWQDRMPSWWLRMVVGALVVALLGTGFFAYRLSSDLTAARETIASQNDKLARTEASLAAATARGEQLTAQVGTLQARVQREQDCVSALRADEAVASKIQQAQMANYNLFAKGSVFAKANLARDAAGIAANEDWYQAYRAAWVGNYAAANTRAARANAQIAIANRNLTTMSAEIDKMNALNGQIEGMLATAGDGLGVCDLSTSSS